MAHPRGSGGRDGPVAVAALSTEAEQSPRADGSATRVITCLENPKNVYDEFGGVLKYLTDLDRLPFRVLSRRYRERPERASGLLAVVKDKDLREFRRTGEPYKVRPCINLKSSEVNELFEDWRMRLAGPASVVRLLGEWMLLEDRAVEAARRSRSGARARTAAESSRPRSAGALRPRALLAAGAAMTGSGGGVIDSRDLVQSPSTTLLQAQVAPHNAGATGSASRTAASDGLSGVGVVLSVRKPSTSGGIGEGTGSYALYGSALNGLSAVRRGCTDQSAAEMTEFAEEEIPRLYISVTDLSKFYLYLALGRNAQALTYFSDPRYESTSKRE